MHRIATAMTGDGERATIRGMFCPQCRAEYRPGFTKCADCGVDLVTTLPDRSESEAKNPTINLDAAVLLWAGVDPRIHERICDALDSADIEYSDEAATPELMSAMRDGVEEIRVRAGDLQRAKAAIAPLWDDDSSQESETHLPTVATSTVNPLHLDQPVFNTGSEPSETDEEELPAEDNEGDYEEYHENFDPEEATTVVWTGADIRMAKIFEDCLSNIGVGCLIYDENGAVMVSVMPAAEKRAKEVIREIEDAAPMA